MTHTIANAVNRLRACRSSIKMTVEYMTAGDMGRGDLCAKDALSQIDMALADLVDVTKRVREAAGTITAGPVTFKGGGL
jgi:predicted enzyme related to lactoylglutathione lyase